MNQLKYEETLKTWLFRQLLLPERARFDRGSCCTEIVPGSFYNKYINAWFGNWSVEKPSTPETLLYARLYPNPTCARRVCGDEQQEHRDTHGWNTEKVTCWFHGIFKKKEVKKKKKVPNFLKLFRTSSPGKSLKQSDELQFGKKGSRRVGKNFIIHF